MALQVKTANRKFVIVKKDEDDNITLKDPNANMSVQEVINHYSTQYPELTTASVQGPDIEEGTDTAVYRFTTVLGDKG